MWNHYERSSPITVKGGIKAQSKRGQFSESWWGKRWIKALESFNDSARLSRGRSYARQGQVLSIDVKIGEIVAKVQGSRETPYKVTVALETLSDSSWQLVIDALSQKAIYTARLLAGELPQDIEEIFNEVKVPLLPTHHGHLKTDCSCPDWSNPCKHVAAVLYLLGEEFDRDPFLLFKVRGMDRDTFLKNLERKALKVKSPSKSKGPDVSGQEPEVPLTDDPTLFWQGAAQPPADWLKGGFDKPIQTGLLTKSLGKFPFWRGESDLAGTLGTTYVQATNHVLNLLT